MLARKPRAGNPSIPSQARCVGVNDVTVLCSLGRTSSPLPGKGTTLGKEYKLLSYYFSFFTDLISLPGTLCTYDCLQDFAVAVYSPLECSASRALQVSNILLFNYLTYHLLWILFMY